MSASTDTDVLIIGAGPTGLVLALWLARLGVRIRIIDKAPEPGTTSRAMAVQARTLEFYGQLGLAEAVVAGGRKARAINLWVAGKPVSRAMFGDMGAGLSPYPYALIFPQDEHERLLTARLADAGVNVERPTTLVTFAEADGCVRARLQRGDGSEEACTASYLVGCDGARSTVREALQIGFPGGTYDHMFYVADVVGSGPVLNGELHVALDATDFLAVFPLKADGHVRLIGTVREGSLSHPENLSWADVSKRVIDWIGINVEQVRWFSTYHVHHRVADRFREGRAFVAGDAAHIHSPVGGQGMNTGIGDAVNLAWKLAAVLQGRASVPVLDTYEPERIAFARRLVATTDQAFTAVTSDGALAKYLRLDVAPRVIPPLFRAARARRFMFRTISQTAVNYRTSVLSDGQAGTVHGGDRLPWTPLTVNGRETDNFAPLTSLDWQAHVYGAAGPDIQRACDARHLPLHVFEWTPEAGQHGLQRDALYLVRPDGYVALADPHAMEPALAAYLDAHAIRPHTPAA